MKIEALIIHLNRATARRVRVNELIEQLPVQASVLEAVDGQTMSDHDIARVYKLDLMQPSYPFKLRPGEVACFLSHRKAWQTALDKGLDAVLILEDDISLNPDVFNPAFAVAQNNCSGISYIKFPFDNAGAKAEPSPSQVTLPIVSPLRAHAQLVSAKACKLLLEHSETFDRPVDVVLQMHWLTHVRQKVISSTGISSASDSLGGTTIHAHKSWAERISREWKRFMFRKRIREFSYLQAEL